MSEFYPTCWKRMADAVLNQATPVSGTKYTVLDTTKNCRIHSIIAKVTWTVQPTPLEVHITIDGNAFTVTQANPVTATNYAVAQSVGTDMLAATGGAFVTAYTADGFPVTLEGRSVKVEAETTGGTVDPLECRVKYSVLR